jgi:4-amino-4-deoxy-L-arabinose transferase-like glycosyltransferase
VSLLALLLLVLPWMVIILCFHSFYSRVSKKALVMLSKKKKALVILYFVGCLYLQVFTPLLLLLLMLDVLDNLIFQIPQQRDNFNNSIFFFLRTLVPSC